MDKHLLSRIKSKYQHLSKGQKLIADFIGEHYDEAAFMTASKLGETVGVSESTVVRFACELGYGGYPKLQKAMQEMIRDKLTSVQRIDVTCERIGGGDVLDSVLNQDIEKIRRTIEETSREDFNNAVKAIVNAENIYIYAVRSTSPLANFLGYYFELIFGNVRVISTSSKSAAYEQLFRITEKDVMIGISFPRYSTMAVDVMHFARERGADVIALTDSMISPLVSQADHLLIARSDMASVVDSLVAPLSMINALIVATVIAKKEDVKKALEYLMQYCKEAGRPFIMYNVTPENFEQLENWYPERFQIEYDRDAADYVYETEKLATLAGKKLHGKRNHINKFKALYPDWSYEALDDDNVEECFQMALKWRNQNGCDDDLEKNAEMCVTLNSLRLYKELGLKGGILRAQKDIVAFTLGEPICNDTFVVHIEKAFPNVEGAYPMINQQFVQHECMDYAYVNREEDTGAEGLRKAKLSYRPVFLVEKGLVTEK